MSSTPAYAWGYWHKTVCHGCGEYARDEDGDGFCKMHLNTIEGFWSLLRSWLRPHRGISQNKLPFYLGFFQLVHNARRRGTAQERHFCTSAAVGQSPPSLRRAPSLRSEMPGRVAAAAIQSLTASRKSNAVLTANLASITVSASFRTV